MVMKTLTSRSLGDGSAMPTLMSTLGLNFNASPSASIAGRNFCAVDFSVNPIVMPFIGLPMPIMTLTDEPLLVITEASSPPNSYGLGSLAVIILALILGALCIKATIAFDSSKKLACTAKAFHSSIFI